MATNQCKQVEEEFQPTSPLTEYINSSVLSLGVLIALEFEVPIVYTSETEAWVRNEFMVINPRFTSILVKDETGVQKWKRVEVRLEDHIYFPRFPDDLSLDDYDHYLKEFMTEMTMTRLSESKPLWEVYVINYPTKRAAGTVVIKINHAVGDGFSLLSGLFACSQRADDPSLPITFPSSSTLEPPKAYNETNIFNKLSGILSRCWNSAYDFGWSVLHSSILEDDRTAIRSGAPLVEFHPKAISTFTLCLDRIRQVRSNIKVTVNDVAMGILSYGIHLYRQKKGEISRGGRMTGLVVLNTRMLRKYESTKSMPDSWGNRITFMQIPVPTSDDVEPDPLVFVLKANKMIRGKRNSLALYITSLFIQAMRDIKGAEAVSRYVHATLSNASFTFSNVVGPVEKLLIAGHPMKNFYFSVFGVPQSLVITMSSYMRKFTFTVAAEKGFMDCQLLVTCMEEAFQKIYEAAGGKDGRFNGYKKLAGCIWPS